MSGVTCALTFYNFERPACGNLQRRWQLLAMRLTMFFNFELSGLRVTAAVYLSCLLLFAISLPAQTLPRSAGPRSLPVTVVDENGVAVPGARVDLTSAGASLHCETDLAGRCELSNIGAGPWELHVEKEGFYLVNLPSVQTSGPLEISLHHQQEVRENVNVVESVPAIDPQQ